MYDFKRLKHNTEKYKEHSNIVYIAINKFNHKCYIGVTTNTIDVRKGEHITNAFTRSIKRPFYNSIRGRGEDAYDWFILEHKESLEDLFELEKQYIKKYNSYFFSKNSCGYNLTLGGEGSCGLKMSKESRSKISNALTGREVTIETRAKISKSNKGKKLSEETKNKISVAHKGRYVGRELTEDWKKNISMNSRSGDPDVKEKLRLAATGKKLNEETKQKLRKPKSQPRAKEHTQKIAEALSGSVSVVDISNMIWYNSYEEASNETGIYLNNIRNVAMGRRKTAGNTKFKRYIDLNEDELVLLISNVGYKPDYNKKDIRELRKHK